MALEQSSVRRSDVVEGALWQLIVGKHVPVFVVVRDLFGGQHVGVLTTKRQWQTIPSDLSFNKVRGRAADEIRSPSRRRIELS